MKTRQSGSLLLPRVRTARERGIVTARRATCAIGCAALLAAGMATAADHADSPSQLANPQADINDLYAFMNRNAADELVLVMTVVPNAGPNALLSEVTTPDAEFSTTIAYDFLFESSTRAAVETPVDNYRIRCTFPTAAQVRCTLGDTMAESAVGALGQTLPDNGMRVYAGLREDPFFFNGPGLNNLLPEGDEFATMAAGDPATIFQAAADANGGVADSFAGQNILAIVLGVDTDLLTGGGAAPVLKLWAATSPLTP